MTKEFDNTNDDELQLLGQCPMCDRQYQPEEATVLREDEEAMMVYTQCVRCRSSVIFAFSPRMGGVMGMVTDMTLPDIRRLHTIDPVQDDDVLDLHKHFVDAA